MKWPLAAKSLSILAAAYSCSNQSLRCSALIHSQIVSTWCTNCNHSFAVHNLDNSTMNLLTVSCNTCAHAAASTEVKTSRHRQQGASHTPLLSQTQPSPSQSPSVTTIIRKITVCKAASTTNIPRDTQEPALSDIIWLTVFEPVSQFQHFCQLGSRLCDLDYADAIALIETSQMGMQQLTHQEVLGYAMHECQKNVRLWSAWLGR